MIFIDKSPTFISPFMKSVERVGGDRDIAHGTAEYLKMDGVVVFGCGIAQALGMKSRTPRVVSYCLKRKFCLQLHPWVRMW